MSDTSISQHARPVGGLTATTTLSDLPTRAAPPRGTARAQSTAPVTGHDWKLMIAPYATPHDGRAALNLMTSAVLYLAFSVATYLALKASTPLGLTLTIPTAAFLVRTFIVFHDCSHGSFFSSKRANAIVGAMLGLFLYVPFLRWKHDHAVHHATSGDLERRGVGDVHTLTVNEFHGLSRKGRLAYALMRNPLVMFGIGPIVAMMIGPRFVARNARPRMRRSVLGTDVALLLLIAGVCWLIGWRNYLLVCGIPALLAGSAGIWLFYVQHQFEDAYWTRRPDWTYADAALKGSSFLKLPRLLQFCSGNIGYHHIHHLDARIPNYNLQRTHDENPVFHTVPTLSIGDGLRAVKLKLWDEEEERLVTFAQARRLASR